MIVCPYHGLQNVWLANGYHVRRTAQGRAAGLLGTTEQALSLWERKGKTPRTADRMFRALYLEAVDGNVKLKEPIERVADLDRTDGDKLIFRTPSRAGFHKPPDGRCTEFPAGPPRAGTRFSLNTSAPYISTMSYCS
jgi:hypothetical protein